MTIYHTVQRVKPEVRTICIGMAMSAAAAGARGTPAEAVDYGLVDAILEPRGVVPG